ncbi:MAG: SPOR domain-containing protein [Bacteroidales bacterium]|nr:SPOR domain-containing protein [Bacteroidales bacterium]
MTDITAYIRELLFSHDCVILPSFGGFIGNYTPAVIERGSNTFSPPRKAISFNRNLNQNDGLLISRISAVRGTGYADARRVVEEFVQEVREKLSKGEHVTFDLIGTFRNNSEGNPVFEPDGSTNFLLGSYGLPVFRRDPAEGYDVATRIMPRSNRGSGKVITRRMVWRAAVALPFIAAMIIVPLKSDLFRSNASLNPLARTQLTEMQAVTGTDDAAAELADESAGAESQLNNVTGGAEAANAGDKINNREPESAVSETATEQDAGNSEITGRAVAAETADAFLVITGSFKAYENATGQQKDLTSKGYSASVTGAPNGYYRVSAASFATWQEADSARKAISDSFPGTWILKK